MVNGNGNGKFPIDGKQRTNTPLYHMFVDYLNYDGVDRAIHDFQSFNSVSERGGMWADNFPVER